MRARIASRNRDEELDEDHAVHGFQHTVFRGVETQALDLADALHTTDLTWTTSGSPLRLPQTNITYDGIAAASSGRVSYPQSAYLDPTLTGPGTRSFWWRFTNSSFASGSLAVSIVGTNQSSLTNHYGNPNASAVVTINPSAPWLITQAPSPTWWLELEVARALGVPSLSLGSFCRLACLLSSAPSCSS